MMEKFGSCMVACSRNNGNSEYKEGDIVMGTKSPFLTQTPKYQDFTGTMGTAMHTYPLNVPVYVKNGF